MRLSDFDYHLPKAFIAQRPLLERDQSRLMVLDRVERMIRHHRFFELPELLDSNSVLVFNESRVIPARLKFKVGNGNAEVLLIKPVEENIGDPRRSGTTWECMVKPGNKFKPKTDILVDLELSLHVKDITLSGLRIIHFKCGDLKAYLRKHGQTPTPPYIKETLDEPGRYQTIYAKTEGSVAAPTAGFHFTPRVFEGLKAKGIQTEFVTLHVGLGTFQPVKTEEIEAHQMHSEWFSLPEDVAKRLNTAKQAGKKIVAVGTTAVRVLEACAEVMETSQTTTLKADNRLSAFRENGGVDHPRLRPRSGETNIFIYPGYQWKFVDQMITNFHVPKSTLLMLVSAFASPEGAIDQSRLQGRDFILNAYETAKKTGYRFFSFGDAMWIH